MNAFKRREATEFDILPKKLFLANPAVSEHLLVSSVLEYYKLFVGGERGCRQNLNQSTNFECDSSALLPLLNDYVYHAALPKDMKEWTIILLPKCVN